MKFYYSAENKEFYQDSWLHLYEKAGTLPDDLVEIDEDEYDAFMIPSPEGKVRGSLNGRPVWVDAPPPTKEQSLEIANNEKKSRLAEANSYTQPWQTQLILGIINDNDKGELVKWMKYYQKVQDTDTSTAPDIDWPEKPS